jgi:hypothetical protein
MERITQRTHSIVRYGPSLVFGMFVSMMRKFMHDISDTVVATRREAHTSAE